MNQRPLATGVRVIPPQQEIVTPAFQPTVEAIAVDKADEAERRDRSREKARAELAALEARHAAATVTAVQAWVLTPGAQRPDAGVSRRDRGRSKEAHLRGAVRARQ